MGRVAVQEAGQRRGSPPAGGYERSPMTAPAEVGSTTDAEGP